MAMMPDMVDERNYGGSWRQLFLAQFHGEIGFLEGFQSLAQECQFFSAKILSIDGRLAAGFVDNSEVAVVDHRLAAISAKSFLVGVIVVNGDGFLGICRGMQNCHIF
jgi:hypothetical protein